MRRMSLEEYTKTHRDEENHKPGDCNTCGDFFTEFDDFGRQYCYCLYDPKHNNAYMNIINKHWKCPETI